jgi:hypothetical protein
MTDKTTLSRRAVVAGSAMLAAVPAFAATPSGPTPIARLWAEAQGLASQLSAHRGAITAAAARTGVSTPGWMRIGGEANAIAEQRYGKLVAILKETPKNQGDLAIIAKVSQDSDIQMGARLWASEKLASATISLAS